MRTRPVFAETVTYYKAKYTYISIRTFNFGFQWSFPKAAQHSVDIILFIRYVATYSTAHFQVYNLYRFYNATYVNLHAIRTHELQLFEVHKMSFNTYIYTTKHDMQV